MANPRVNENLVIENARLLFRNFSGRESKYNRAGQRNFCVYIEDAADAQKLIDDGWNVRVRPPREDGEEPRYYIQVAVSFENIPPTVYMITKRKKVKLDEESIDTLRLRGDPQCGPDHPPLQLGDSGGHQEREERR